MSYTDLIARLREDLKYLQLLFNKQNNLIKLLKEEIELLKTDKDWLVKILKAMEEKK